MADGGNSTWSTGDFDGNGDFDSGDLIFEFASGDFELGPAAASAVPEASKGGLKNNVRVC